MISCDYLKALCNAHTFIVEDWQNSSEMFASIKLLFAAEQISHGIFVYFFLSDGLN